MIVGKSDEHRESLNMCEFNGDNIHQGYSDDSNICNEKEIKHKDGILTIRYMKRCK